MRDATDGERALGCPDRGILGGFAAGVLRYLRADQAAGGSERRWAMAALTSYGLKNPDDRAKVCVRLRPLLPAVPHPDAGGLGPEDRIDALPGVGAKQIERFASLGIHTVGDLLEHVPRAYLDRRTMKRIADLRVGEEVTVVAVVREAKAERTRNNKRYAKAILTDGSGYLECIWWGQDWRARQLTPGTEVAVSGKVDRHGGRPQMANPACDPVGRESEALSTGRVVPVYPASEAVDTHQIRRLVSAALARIGRLPDPVPARIRAARNLLGRDLAVRLMHFPDDPAQVPDARRRLVFEELFTLEVGLALRKRHLEADVRGIAHDRRATLPGEFLATLPFRPTGAQGRAMREIAEDMAQPRPMHRLLQGEVGSGKTLVAVHAALVAVGSGNQAAIMAPTEVLAEQHARKIRALVEPLGVDVALLTSSVPAAQRRDTLMRLASGDTGIACGTHALLTEGVGFKRLSLAIVDEQHRFGLRQRIMLKSKGTDPDVLIMTATPIPRTLALTLYGDLDVTVLDELPAGRRPIATVVVPNEDARGREQAYDLIRREVAEGRRAYVICALVDESDTSQAKAAVAEAERLRTEVFPSLDVGLVHGSMRPADKERVMRGFRDGEVSVLIATTVVEVGVDVPEATVMLIEDAERFGLSQLHQLRGRVGRGTWASYCILFADTKTPESRARLDAIAASTDGFELAEQDLKIRGEGTIFGTRQAGMPDLKLARIVEDFPVLVEAREEAFALVDADPRLSSPEHALLRSDVRGRFEGIVDWLFHG